MTSIFLSPCLLMSLNLTLVNQASQLPTVTLKGDDTKITESCRIVIPPDLVIEDANENGVIQIEAPNITVEFAQGSVLRGAKRGTQPEEYKGFGVRVVGQAGVTIRNARVAGFLGNVYATRCDGLTLENIDASDARRAFLKSTPVAEDGGDWLWPHRNDENEWLKNYGAALCVEDSTDVTVRKCRVRNSQNGLILDRVDDSRVYDNDCSFLSGWGLAMWRCNHNKITRNAFDFCVRGYSHRVYNRGQDSAGILFFEQNNHNLIAENSATHGGDGIFGFAGREAIGEVWWEEARDKLRKELGKEDVEKEIKVADEVARQFKRKGCNDNLLINNDFSYAPAHGIEMTFCFGNQFIGNRLVGNAICGVWGGYSQDTLIANNTFEENGEMGYGLERGGVNIEHGRGNKIVHNTFRGNRAGVHLWWDDEGNFLDKPWGKANGSASSDNLIAGNAFDSDELVFHFRGKSDVTLGKNTITNAKREMNADENVKVARDDARAAPEKPSPTYEALGETRPVGARKHLYGRENIVMTEWGPWDHESPLLRLVEARGRERVYDLHQMPADVKVEVQGAGVESEQTPAENGRAARCVVRVDKDGVYPFTLRVTGTGYQCAERGTIVSATWDAKFFTWTIDPRQDVEGWRKLADGPDAKSAKIGQLLLKYGFGGPKDQKLSEELSASKIGGERFGMIAKTRLPLTKGKWRVSTTSDDGVRVTADGKPVIDNWTWHVPTRDTGELTLDADRTVEIVVEHFEIDGFSTLEFEIGRAE
ncbi:MAG: right-handed parallel beta-helix repeat-containing protein [Phycisphaerae bacterium]